MDAEVAQAAEQPAQLRLVGERASERAHGLGDADAVDGIELAL